MGNKPSRGKALKTAKETKWLDISDNKLRSIPVEVFVTQPRGLNISLNSIMLPEDIGTTLPALEFLDCSGCSLLKLPKSVISLINLKELILTRNSLSVLPPLPASLEKLDISYNMFVQVPEHLNELPNLCWVSLEGNPCYVPNKVLVPLKGKAKIQTIVYGNTEIPVDNSIRLNMKELEILSEVFEDISAPVPGETGMTYIDRDDMMKRMGLSFLPVTTLVDAFFRAFCSYSLPQTKKLYGEMIDVKAFFVGLCIIFKGTVEEKLKFSFDIFDMNGDGFIELQDLKAIAKSALLAAMVLTNQYNLTEEEYARYAKEVSRNKLGIEGMEEEQGSNDKIKVLAKEMDLSLLCGTKVLSQLRVQQRSVQDVMNHKAYKSQWPVFKEAIGKQYKEMLALSPVPTNKISFKEYQRYWLSNFSAINEFLNFYGSMFRYGP